MRRSILLFIAALLVDMPATAQLISNDERQVRLYSYALSLWRAGEPNLIDSCIGSRNTIRLTKSVYLRGASVISVSKDHDKVQARRSTVPADGDVSSKSSAISKNHWERVIAALRNTEFWSMDIEEDVWRTHTTRYLIEACIDEKYHGVERYSHRSAQFEKLVRELDAILNDS